MFPLFFLLFTRGEGVSMTLSIRLEAILSVLEKTDCLADIGTDHGFLPIEAIRRGLASRAVACDLREGPLERARAHILESGLEQQAECRLSDGFSALAKGEAQTVVIAGMGGDLVCEILRQAHAREDKVLDGVTQLILQPQSEWEKVRRVLPEIGFRSVFETMVTDRDKVYWIWRCVPGMEVMREDWQWVWGLDLAERRDPLWRDYLRRQREIRLALAEKLENNPSAASLKRQQELKKEIGEITEALAYGNDGSEDR